jgi:hypothetical protein
MKKTEGNKPVEVIIHIYMEIAQENALCSYLSKQVKISYFSFYDFSFFSYKIGEQESRTRPALQGGVAPVGGEKCWGKGVGG